jgi:hypothetical protein
MTDPPNLEIEPQMDTDEGGSDPDALIRPIRKIRGPKS